MKSEINTKTKKEETQLGLVDLLSLGFEAVSLAPSLSSSVSNKPRELPG